MFSYRRKHPLWSSQRDRPRFSSFLLLLSSVDITYRDLPVGLFLTLHYCPNFTSRVTKWFSSEVHNRVPSHILFLYLWSHYSLRVTFKDISFYPIISVLPHSCPTNQTISIPYDLNHYQEFPRLL